MAVDKKELMKIVKNFVEGFRGFPKLQVPENPACKFSSTLRQNEEKFERADSDIDSSTPLFVENPSVIRLNSESIACSLCLHWTRRSRLAATFPIIKSRHISLFYIFSLHALFQQNSREYPARLG